MSKLPIEWLKESLYASEKECAEWSTYYNSLREKLEENDYGKHQEELCDVLDCMGRLCEEHDELIAYLENLIGEGK